MHLNQIRRTFLGTLILVLLLTGKSIAQMRIMPAGVGQMVICTTGGSKTIWIDGKGQPTGRDHICPDCMLVFVYLGADGGQLIEPFKVLLGQSVHFVVPKIILLSFWAARLPRAPPNFSDFKTL